VWVAWWGGWAWPVAGAGLGDATIPGGGVATGDLPVWDDGQVMARLAAAAAALRDAGKTVPMTTLTGQLGRAQCGLRLPRPHATKVDLPGLVRRCENGVVIVGHLYQCGKCSQWHVNTATGFMLTADGALVTCAHVLEQSGGETLCIMRRDGRVEPVVEVLAADRAADVVILRAAGAKYQPLSLGSGAPVGSPVTVISHADRRFYTLTAGVVSRYSRRHGPAGDATVLAITADFARGSSGAPVLDAAGNVVGVAQSTVSKYYHQAEHVQENLQMVFKVCAPVAAVRRLIGAGSAAHAEGDSASGSGRVRDARSRNPR